MVTHNLSENESNNKLVSLFFYLKNKQKFKYATILLNLSFGEDSGTIIFFLIQKF